jgi:hypothetical protein
LIASTLERNFIEISPIFLRFSTATDPGATVINMPVKIEEIAMSSRRKKCLVCFFEGLLAAIAAHLTAWLAIVSASAVWQWIGHVAGVLTVHVISTATGF